MSRISSKRSASVIMKGGTGAAFIITPACAWQPTASWWPSAAFFPLSTAWPASGSPHLRYPAVSRSAVPPIRPERHVPYSITSVRRRLTVALVQTLPRCPCCLTSMVRCRGISDTVRVAEPKRCLDEAGHLYPHPSRKPQMVEPMYPPGFLDQRPGNSERLGTSPCGLLFGLAPSHP